MKKISTAELKKAILAVEAERAKHPAPFRPDRSQRAALQKSAWRRTRWCPGS